MPISHFLLLINLYLQVDSVETHNVLTIHRWSLSFVHPFFHLIFVERTFIQTIRALPRVAIQYLTDLNLFPSSPPTTNLNDLRTQHISTRTFIFLLIVTLTILLLYTSTVPVLQTVTVPAHTLDQYYHLYEKYSQTLTCPCTKISINYETFIHVNYSFHHICNSIFVTEQWTTYMENSIPSLYWTNDFRLVGLHQFVALRAFCDQVEQVIAAGLVQFYANKYVSAFVTSLDLLRSQAAAFTKQFISSTTNSFSSSLRLIRDTTQVNALFSALFTNYYLVVPTNSFTLNSFYVTYDGDCDCRTSSGCITRVEIYNDSQYDIISWYMPGFYYGCFILEALRQSHLECLYIQSCLNDLILHMESRTFWNVTALNSSMLIHFSPSTIIGVIMDEMMVDAWNWSVDHAGYYAACQPEECRYTIIAKNGVIYIVTMLIGLVGGLVTVLKFIVPRIISFIMKRIQKRKQNTVQPFMGSSQQLPKAPTEIHVENLET